MENKAQFILYNIKIHFFLPCLSSLGVLILTAVLFGITGLYGTAAAQPAEMFLSLMGLTMLTPLFYPEENKAVREVVRSRKMDYLQVVVSRLIYSVATLALLEGVFMGMLLLGESEVTWRLFSGGFGTALFLGMTGLFAAALSGRVVIGYMAGMLFYVANFALRRELGVFFLFSMSVGGAGKEWMYVGAGVMCIATFIVLYLRRKCM